MPDFQASQTGLGQLFWRGAQNVAPPQDNSNWGEILPADWSMDDPYGRNRIVKFGDNLYLAARQNNLRKTVYKGTTNAARWRTIALAVPFIDYWGNDLDDATVYNQAEVLPYRGTFLSSQLVEFLQNAQFIGEFLTDINTANIPFRLTFHGRTGNPNIDGYLKYDTDTRRFFIHSKQAMRNTFDTAFYAHQNEIDTANEFPALWSLEVGVPYLVSAAVTQSVSVMTETAYYEVRESVRNVSGSRNTRNRPIANLGNSPPRDGSGSSNLPGDSQPGINPQPRQFLPRDADVIRGTPFATRPGDPYTPENVGGNQDHGDEEDGDTEIDLASAGVGVVIGGHLAATGLIAGSGALALLGQNPGAGSETGPSQRTPTIEEVERAIALLNDPNASEDERNAAIALIGLAAAAGIIGSGAVTGVVLTNVGGILIATGSG